MLREGTLEEISDGKLYKINDMVKADAMGCKGCSKCCEEMVDTIYLTPLDLFRMERVTGKNFEELLSGPEPKISLQVVEGMVCPSLFCRQQEGQKGCAFLNAEGRCEIHGSRPELCRLFPLGRYYVEGDFYYILQTGQCDRPRTKTKVKKWIDTPDYDMNREYVLRWHDISMRMRERAYLAGLGEEELITRAGQVNSLFLKTFFQNWSAPGEGEETGFYPEFAKRADSFIQYLDELDVEK